MHFAAKYGYISISSKLWERGIQWLADSIKRKHRDSLLHHKTVASGKPEMKLDSFNKMSISPRRVEHLNTLENQHLGGRYFILSRYVKGAEPH